MVHPNDTRRQKETLPAYITQGTISQKTKQRIVELVEQLGYPDAILSSTVVKETGMDPGWANRALYHSGFRPGPAKNKRVGRPWYTPEEILELKDKPKAHEVAETPMSQEDSDETSAVDDAIAQILTEAESEHEEAIETEGPLEVDEMPIYQEPDVSRETVPGPEPVEHIVEFIDERDSWTVDMEELLGGPLNRMVRDRLEVLRAVGMDYEFRVWRKN